MWKRADVKEDNKYRVALCQQDSTRFFKLVEYGKEDDNTENRCFLTEVVPNSMLLKGGVGKIAAEVKMTNGSRFEVDAHGMWLTLAEAEALIKQVPFDKIPWHKGKKPRFAPK